MTKLKDFFVNLFLKEEKLQLLISREVSDNARNSYQEKIKALEEERKSLNVVDIVREQLKGFNPRLLDSEADILEQFKEEDALDSFLDQVHELSENNALGPIFDYLIRNQILYTAKEAEQMASINFGRSTINGFVLLREEIERLEGIYKERHIPEDKFDTQDVL